jgi:hypothetical protein
MSKVTLNGTTGLTAYKADNTTVEVQYTPAQLVAKKPSVFTSASPFIIRGGLTVDATTYPAKLKYDDGTETDLLSYEANYVTSNTEIAYAGDRTHQFPTGIQAGDILVMLQVARLRSSAGYAPTLNVSFGDGFTKATGNINSQVTNQVFNYYSGNYDITDSFVSYKIADGSENGASIGGFIQESNPYGTAGGWRRLMVFRPTYVVNSVSDALFMQSTGFIVSEYAGYHTYSVNPTHSGQYATIFVSLHTAYSNVAGPTVSGDFSSLSNVVTYNYQGCMSYVHTGAVTATPNQTSITLTGQYTNSPEILHGYALTLVQ